MTKYCCTFGSFDKKIGLRQGLYVVGFYPSNNTQQSQCLALCLVPPPEASAKGGRITLSPPSPISPNPPLSQVNFTLSKSDTSALLDLGGTLLQC